MTLKKILTISTIAISATAAYADNVSRVKVYDHNKTIYTEVPVTNVYCRDVQMPIYDNVQTQGDAAGGALAGMIIGGILGKGVSGNDDGAAAGAVIGGLIGADKGSKPRSEKRVVGYEMVEKCEKMNTYETVEKEVYSHSTIRFYLNGTRYVLRFEK